jgi:hypothetical protein
MVGAPHPFSDFLKHCVHQTPDFLSDPRDHFRDETHSSVDETSLSPESPHSGDDVMFTKSKAALAAALVLGSTSLAMAQSYDPNLSNRYPGLADPGVYGYSANGNGATWMHGAPGAAPQVQSAPVRLHGRNAALTNGQNSHAPGNFTGTESEFDVDRFDRASSPYAGGGY